MSEFQFYGFRSIDRNLTKEEQRDVSSWSSRSEPTANSLTLVYNYGDFSHNEEAGLENYFDVMLYYANFGCKKIMFRLPVEAVDYEAIKQYANKHSYDFDNEIAIYKKGKYVIVKIDCNDEYFDFYDDPEDYFNKMTEWRQMLMDGDYRLLFWAWLHIQSLKEEQAYPDDEDFEAMEEETITFLPPLPYELNKTPGSIKDFANFFQINDDWLAAALLMAKKTPNREAPSPVDHKSLISRLSDTTKDDFLQRLLNQETNLHLKLKKKLEEITGVQRQAMQQSKWTTKDLYKQVLGK